jgi:hypothetical protein
VQVRGQLIEVDMTHEETAYRLIEGGGLPIEHRGEQVRLTAEGFVRQTGEAALEAA